MIERALRKAARMIKRRLIPSAKPLPDPPWFDRPDALTILERRRRKRNYPDQEFECLRKWINDGYFVVEKLIPAAPIDAMNRDIDNLFTTDTPCPGLLFHGLKLHPEDTGDVSHERLLELPVSERLELKTKNRWRIHYFVAQSEPTRQIFESDSLKHWLALIFDRPVSPRHSINFAYGSEQDMHQDMAVFPIKPSNYLVGIWIAGEDVSPDCGPLVFCPGSHKDPMWSGFHNYPYTYMRNCSKEVTLAYKAYLKEEAKKYERHLYLGNKGDVLFWHGMLMHGGEAIRDPKLTRKSLILHAEPAGCDITEQLPGPFNW